MQNTQSDYLCPLLRPAVPRCQCALCRIPFVAGCCRLCGSASPRAFRAGDPLCLACSLSCNGGLGLQAMPAAWALHHVDSLPVQSKVQTECPAECMMLVCQARTRAMEAYHDGQHHCGRNTNMSSVPPKVSLSGPAQQTGFLPSYFSFGDGMKCFGGVWPRFE